MFFFFNIFFVPAHEATLAALSLLVGLICLGYELYSKLDWTACRLDNLERRGMNGFSWYAPKDVARQVRMRLSEWDEQMASRQGASVLERWLGTEYDLWRASLMRAGIWTQHSQRVWLSIIEQALHETRAEVLQAATGCNYRYGQSFGRDSQKPQSCLVAG